MADITVDLTYGGERHSFGVVARKHRGSRENPALKPFTALVVEIRGASYEVEDRINLFFYNPQHAREFAEAVLKAVEEAKEVER